MSAWLVVQGLILQRPRAELLMIPSRIMKHRIVPVVLPAAARMRQQVMQSDLGHSLRVVFSIIKPEHSLFSEDQIIQVNPAFFNQRKNGNRRDWFADACNAEQVRR